MADHDGGTGGSDDHGARRAIISGVVALVAVALSVGLVLGGVALGVTSVLGVGGEEKSGGGGKDEQSLYLPKLTKSEDDDGPQTTLATDQTPSGAGSEPSESETTPKDEISLQAGQSEVGSYDPIDLTGVYTGGEGAILRVQRFENGSWADFDVTIPVSDETFATYVQTSVTGVNRWRVIDTDTGTTSNEVKVTVN